MKSNCLKSPKKRLLVAARTIHRGDRIANTANAIRHLRLVSSNPERKASLRKAANVMSLILEHTQRDGRKILRNLVEIDEKHNLSIGTVVRVFSAPLAFTTLKAKLRDLASKRLSFSDFMDAIDASYERRVPHRQVEEILNCQKGKFYEKIFKAAFLHGSPRSFITNVALKRMHLLGLPKKNIDEANRLRWQIHGETHDMYEAMRAGDVEAEKLARANVRAMQSDFINRFVKGL